MQQWLGLHPLAAFALRRIGARGWHVSVHFVSDVTEMHAMRIETGEAHIARCNDGDEPPHQFRPARVLAEAVGVVDVVRAGGRVDSSSRVGRATGR
jgi:hypothetical protein